MALVFRGIRESTIVITIKAGQVPGCGTIAPAQMMSDS